MSGRDLGQRDATHRLCIHVNDGHGHEDTEAPSESDHSEDAAPGALLGVPDAVLDGPVAVEGDAGEVEDGGGAQHDVDGEEEVAEVEVEEPGAGAQLQRDVEGQDADGDEEVGERQRDDEVVLHGLQRLVGEDGEDDERVAEGAGDADRDVDGHWREGRECKRG